MDIKSFAPEIRGRIRENASLASMCWFGVGGVVDALFQPADVEDLAYFMRSRPKDMPYFVFGVGSNLIIRDEGFRGVAIRLGRGFNYAHVAGENLIFGGACLDLNAALFAMENYRAGLEFLSGIPGTIGGALAMNAGAYGREIKDVLISAKAVSESGEIVEFSLADLQLEYRQNPLAKGHIFVEATLASIAGDRGEIAAAIDEIQAKRASTQPIKSKTGGSTFKNPVPHKAWELIDQAGCRGLAIGGAQVSPMHCNFFINTGDATAADLLNLIAEVQRRVFATSGVQLEAEIKVI